MFDDDGGGGETAFCREEMLVVILVLCANTVEKDDLEHPETVTTATSLGGRLTSAHKVSQQPTTKTSLGSGWSVYICPLHVCQSFSQKTNIFSLFLSEFQWAVRVGFGCGCLYAAVVLAFSTLPAELAV